MLKRLISCAAAFCLAASLIPATALANASETRLVAAAEGRTAAPLTVSLNDLDPLKPSEEGGYAANPFHVTATITATENVSNVAASISVSPDVLVIDEALSETVPLNTFASGEQKSVGWTVRAIPQENDTAATVTVTVSCNGFEKTTAETTITLKAIADASKRTFIVTFAPNEGMLAEGMEPSATVSAGSLVPQPVNPAKEDNRFMGWYANPKCEGLPWYNALNSYEGEPVTGNITLYAKWSSTKDFSRNVDGFQFYNSAEDFFIDPKDEDALNYSLLHPEFSDGLIKQLAALDHSDYANAQRKLQGAMANQWGGSCFGMCALVALMFAGDIPVDYLQPGAMNAHALNYPKYQSRVKDAINYYYLEQSYGELYKLRGNYRSVEKINNERLVKLLDPTSDTHSSYPVIIGIDLFRDSSNSSRAGGHAVLAYGMKEHVEGSNYEIDIWDPNDPYGSQVNTLFISDNFESSWFNAEYDNGYYHHSFLKYSLPVEDRYNNGINVRDILSSGLSTNSMTRTSRTVQLASDDSSQDMVEIETNYLNLKISGPSSEDINQDQEINIENGVLAQGSDYASEVTIDLLSDSEGSTRMRVRVPVFSVALALRVTPDDDDGGLELSCNMSNAPYERSMYATSVSPSPASVVLSNWRYTINDSWDAMYNLVPGSCALVVYNNTDQRNTLSYGWSLREDLYLKELEKVGLNAQRLPMKSAVHSVHMQNGRMLNITCEDTTSYSSYECDSQAYPGVDPVIITLSDGISSRSTTYDWHTYAATLPSTATNQTGRMTLTYREESAEQGRLQVAAATYDEASGTSGTRDIASESFQKAITFNTNGGSAIETLMNVGKGSALRDLPVPQRDGFLFDGWYKSQTCDPSEVWDSYSDMVNDNMPLYAKWRRDPGFSHRVTFKNAKVGEKTQDVVFLVNDGDPITNIPDTEFSFYNWDCKSEEFTSVKRDITTKATYGTPEPAPTYGVEIDKSALNGTIEIDDSSSTSGLYEGNTVKVKVVPGEGYRGEIDVVEKSGEAIGRSIAVNAQGKGVYAFTMPASDVKVSARFVEATEGIPQYAINISSTQASAFAATVSGKAAAQAERGDNVTLTVTPPKGYELNTSTFCIKSSDGEIVPDYRNENDRIVYRFIMPGSAVTVEGALVLKNSSAPKYSIDWSPVDADRGTIKANLTSAPAETPIELEVIANTGYELDTDSISIMSGGQKLEGVTVEASEKGYLIKFTMPAGDVSVSVDFVEKTYDILLGSMEHGSMSVTPDKAKAGETVTLSVAGDDEFVLKEGTLKVVSAEGTEVPCTPNDDGTYSFTMPASNVTVGAKFVKKTYKLEVVLDPATSAETPEYGVKVSYEGEEGFLDANTKLLKGDRLALRPFVTEGSGWELVGMTYTYQVQGYAQTTVTLTSPYELVMPGADVTVNASFAKKRDTNASYLQFVDKNSTSEVVDVKAKSIGIHEDPLALTVEEVIIGKAPDSGEKEPEGTEPDTDETKEPESGKDEAEGGESEDSGSEASLSEESESGSAATIRTLTSEDAKVKVSNEDILAAAFEETADGDRTGRLLLTPKHEGTATVTVWEQDKYEDGQVASCVVTVTPYKAQAHAQGAASSWDAKTTVKIGKHPIVAQQLAKDNLRFRVQTLSDEALASKVAEKAPKDKLVRLVDLSFVNDKNEAVTVIGNAATSIELKTVPRTVTFALDTGWDEYLAQGLYVAHLDPTAADASKQWEIFTPDLVMGTLGKPDSFSFTTDHFSTYAIMAKNAATPTPTTDPEPAKTKYNVNVPASIVGGSVVASPGSASEGDEVTITTTPQSSAYELKSIAVVDASSSPLTLYSSGNTHKFNMPASEVTVLASFGLKTQNTQNPPKEPTKAKYKVNVPASIANGSITVSPASASEGDQVTITATPKSSAYELKDLSVRDAGGSYLRLTNSGNTYKFTMPANDVNISGSFGLKSQSEWTNDDDDERTYGYPLYDNDDGSTYGGQNTNQGPTATYYSTGNRAGTSTAGQSAAGGSSPLSKTGDEMAVAIACTAVMTLVILAAIAFLRRNARRS